MSNAVANQLFLVYLGRPVDSAWRAATRTVLEGGAPFPALQEAFYAAAVLDGVFSPSEGSGALVNKIFQNIFGFSASAFEQNAWARLIDGGAITAAGAAWTIFTSYLGATNVPAAYQLPAQSKLLVIEAYTNAVANNPAADQALARLGGGAAQTARSFLAGVSSQETAAPAIIGVATTVASLTATPASGPASVPVTTTAQTFTLVSGLDVLTGGAGNDTFTANNSGVAKTLTASDTLNGGLGTDRLEVTLAPGDQSITQSAAGGAAPTLTSIETLAIIGGRITDFTLPASVTNLGVILPTVNTAATYRVASGQTVALLNHAATADTVTTIGDSALGAAPTALTVQLTGQAQSGGVNSLNFSGVSLANLTIDSSTTANAITLANSGGALRTVTINGAANLTMKVNSAASETLTKIDASAATGAIAVTMSAQNSSSFTFKGGAGNDTLTLANGALGVTSAGALDGGGGTDKLILTASGLLSDFSYGRLNSMVGFEVLGVGSLSEVDGSKISNFGTVALDNSGLSFFFGQYRSTFTVALNANTTLLTLNPASGVTSGTITMSGGVTLNSLDSTGLSAVSIASNGASANSVVMVNTDSVTVTITGAQAFSLSLTGNGAQAADGSAATGALTVSGSASNDVIKGGAGADVIIGNGGADRLTGAGGDDQFNYNRATEMRSDSFSASDTTTANIEKITDFTGNGAAAGDRIKFNYEFSVGNVVVNDATQAIIAAVTVTTAADFTALTAAVNGQSNGLASSAASLFIYDVTVSAGNLAGRYLILNNEVGAITTDDAILALTGITGALNAEDFFFGS